ncbi:MAG TPA: Ig-like domain-containing protein, partial [Verrucomicrobiae bacterium]|nr:Ig-like domain-containing protein [Verrucomicrobiae bacterium]
MITPHHYSEKLPRLTCQLCLMAALFALLVVISPAAQAAKVLFVTTGAQRDTVKLENILQAQEHALTIHDTTVSGNALTAAEYAAQGYELLIVDEVISSGAVGDRFRNSPVPVINMEGFLYSNGRSLFNAGTGLTGGTFSNATFAAEQDLAGVADFGQVQNTTAINVVNPSHPLAAGLPAGQVDVWDPATPPLDGDGAGLITFASARTFTTNVQVVATVPGFANGYCVWGVDAGVLNADGTTTNLARWVHLPWNDTDTAERVMIEPSFFLFEAAVAWALDLPEPTKIYNLKLAGTNTVTFSVDKLTHSGSAVAQTSIGLSLDGVDIPNANLAIVSNGDQWDVSYTGLLANKDYTAVASATAADGGFSARLVQFNTFPKVTFSPSYYTIEAEDFNFGGGQFFDAITLCNTIGGGTPGCYFDRIGFTNIDKLEINFAQTVVVPLGTETYRFGDAADLIRDEWVDTYLTTDPLVRTQYTMASIPDYEVRSITNGEWLNYTRTIPATNYNIYAQLASSSALRVHLDFVTSGATTTEQTLQPVGDFIRTSGTGGAYELVPLTDDTGTNLIVVPFNGTTRTMRFTALSSGYTANFFMFVPTAEQIRPIVAITNPPNGALVKEGEQITVGAEAQDPDGTISQVEFFAGTNEPLTSIGVDTVAPYSAQFTPPVLGMFATYTIRAVATDNNNNTSQTSINVTAQPPSTLPPAGKLADIIWVSFHSNGIPSAGAAGVGFTNAPDQAYTDLLSARGYNVTRYITTGTPDPAVLNAADLVIIGRSIDSANYQNASATAWNSIAAPIINMSGYTLRNNRLGFVTASTTPVDSTNDLTLTVSNPAHPIFAGIALAGGTMVNPFAVAVNYPPEVTNTNVPRGISISPDPVDADGTVLATVSPAGNGPVGAMVIAEWPAGATLTHAGGAGTDTLAGRRLVFLSGSREGVGVSSQTAGLFDLTADGTKMFLNAVEYMLHPQPYKVTWVTFHSGDAAPSTDAAAAGFTNAPDKGYTDLLTANGYQVTRYVSTGTPDAATLNAADVVIIGRSVDSANYASAAATAWNNITSPIMVMSGFATRLSRMGFTSGNTVADITNNVTLTVSDPEHYIFHGISLTGGTMNNPFAGLVPYPEGVTFANPPRGISLNTDSVNAGGNVLATI